MPNVNEKVINKPGFRLHVIETTQFKTNTLVWKMKAPLDSTTVSQRALLPFVLQSGTKNYPTTAKLRSYLDELYGTNLSVDLAKKGNEHIITLSIDIVNEKFLQDQTPLLEKAFTILYEVLFNPREENNQFTKEIVEKEKRNLQQKIKAVYDDKMRYASLRLVEEMCKGEDYAIPVYGTLEEVDRITSDGLYQFYKQTLAENDHDLYVIGDVKAETVENFVEAFPLRDRTQKQPKSEEKKKIEKVKEIKETQDIQQGKLNIGYRTHITYADDDYFALQLANGLFGGYPHSKLFINVREKASLAYYAASRLESFKGLLMVMSGIENSKYDEAVTIIEKQLESMRAGDFTEEELEQTKAVYRNQYLETTDSARGLIEILYNNIVAGVERPLADWDEEMSRVTREDVIRVMQNIEPDTIYFLSGKVGDEK